MPRALATSLVLATILLSACGGGTPTKISSTSKDPTRLTAADLRMPVRILRGQPRGAQLRLAHLCLERQARAAGDEADARTSDPKRGRLLRRQAEEAVLGYGDEQARSKMLVAASVGSGGATLQSVCDDLGGAFAESARPPSIDIQVAGAESDVSLGDFVAFKSQSRSPVATLEVTFAQDAPSPQVRVQDRTAPDSYRAIGGTARVTGAVVRISVPLSGEAPTFRVLARARPGGAEARQDVTIERPAGAVNASGGTVPSPPPTRRQQIRRLLEHKNAVGLSKEELRAALGRPDQTQDVGDTLYWYYDTSANSYQVVILGGEVDQVNRYGNGR